MTTFDNTDRTFSVYSFTNKKTKKRIKNPDKSWFRVEIHDFLWNDSSVSSSWVKVPKMVDKSPNDEHRSRWVIYERILTLTLNYCFWTLAINSSLFMGHVWSIRSWWKVYDHFAEKYTIFWLKVYDLLKFRILRFWNYDHFAENKRSFNWKYSIERPIY